VRLSDAISVVKLLALAGVCGSAFVVWLFSPFYATIGFGGWRAIAVIVAAGLGGIGVLANGSWIPVGIATAIGFIGGAAWVEWRFTDVQLGLADSLWNALVIYGRDALALCVAASIAGAFVTQMILRRVSRKHE
jgi:hypothetical protein